jgi:hypothetical protein
MKKERENKFENVGQFLRVTNNFLEWLKEVFFNKMIKKEVNAKVRTQPCERWMEPSLGVLRRTMMGVDKAL